jgi:uncharacterized membrane protein
MQNAENRRVACIGLAVVGCAWAGALAAGPWLSGVADGLSGLLYAAGGLICHQRPERSFHVGASQLPVCARCLGLYAGGAVGLVAWAMAVGRRRTAWPRASAVLALVASGVPTALTVASAWIGLGDPPNAWRAALGLPLGAVAGLVVGAATSDHLK